MCFLLTPFVQHISTPGIIFNLIIIYVWRGHVDPQDDIEKELSLLSATRSGGQIGSERRELRLGGNGAGVGTGYQ